MSLDNNNFQDKKKEEAWPPRPQLGAGTLNDLIDEIIRTSPAKQQITRLYLIQKIYEQTGSRNKSMLKQINQLCDEKSIAAFQMSSAVQRRTALIASLLALFIFLAFVFTLVSGKCVNLSGRW